MNWWSMITFSQKGQKKQFSLTFAIHFYKKPVRPSLSNGMDNLMGDFRTFTKGVVRANIYNWRTTSVNIDVQKLLNIINI